MKFSKICVAICAVVCLVLNVSAGNEQANSDKGFDESDIIYAKSLEEHVILLHLGAITNFAPGAQMKGAELTIEQRNRICYEMFEVWLIFYGPKPSGDPKKPYVEKLLRGMRVWYRDIAKTSDIYTDPLRVLNLLRQEGGKEFAKHAGRLVGVDSSQVRSLEDYQKIVAGFHAWIEKPL